MTKINQDCDLTIREHGSKVTEVSAIYNNKFVRRIYLGCDKKQATKKFTDALKKGEIV